jgi:Bacterial membrane protein YfhO
VSGSPDRSSAVALQDAPPGSPPAPGDTAARGGRLARAMSALRARPMLAAALIYAVLSVVMVGQGLFPGRTLSPSDFLYNDAPWQAERPASVTGIGANFELVDIAEVFQPFLRYNRSTLPTMPLWNPYISGGRPYLGNGQSAVFSPFNVPAYILPFWTSLAVIAALKLFIAALGTFALARRLGMRFGGALLSGLIFAFGTFFIVLLSWPETSIFPILPWLLLLADVLVAAPTLLAGAGAALLVALTYFGGHPETTFHILFAAIVFFVWRLLVRMRSERGPPRAALAPVLAFLASLVAGTLIAAVVIVPFAELLTHSNEYSRRVSAGADHWSARYLGALFLHDYWGRATQQSNVAPFMQVRGWYAGALTLILAPIALLIRPTLTRIGIALFAAFSVCMVVGIPPVFNAVVKVPGFSSTHNEPMIIYFLLCVGLLAGWGLDELSGRQLPTGRLRTLIIAGTVGVFLVPFAWMAAAGTLTTHELGSALKVAWGFADPPHPAPFHSVDGDIVRMSAVLQWIVLAGVGVVLVLWRLRGRRTPLAATAFVTAAVVLMVLDLFRANMGFNPAIATANAKVPATGAIRYLQSQRPNRFVGASTSTAFEPMPADLAMDFRLFDARGYDYPTEQRYDTLWRQFVNNSPTLSQPTELAAINPQSLRALSLLSVSDIIASPGEPPSTFAGLKPVYRGRDAIVYHNAAALPRAFLVGHQQTVESADAALSATTSTSFHGRRFAVTEGPISGIPEGSDRADGSSGAAHVARYAPEKVTVDATATRAGLLVLTDVFYPGWKVTVDGRPAKIERVDYLLRGVRVGAGHHVVRFSYEPSSFTIGWIISVISLLAVLVLGGVGWARLRRRRG